MATRLVACAAVAASALACALYARVAWPWLVLGWIGLVPWLAMLERTRSLGEALQAGIVMAVAFVLAVFGWFATAIAAYTGAPVPLALVVLTVGAPLLEPQLITFALARHVLRARDLRFWHRTLIGASVWVGTEWASRKLLADTLGHGLWASIWMRQAADLAGAHGLTFVLVIANEAVLAVAQAMTAARPVPMRLRRALAPAGCLAGLVAGLLVYGAVRCRQLAVDSPSRDAVAVGVVQADIARYDRLAAEVGKFDAVQMILDSHFALSVEALRRGRLDLLVWPETVYPTTFGSPKSEAGADFDRAITGFVARAGVPLVFGAYEAAGGEEFNAAVFLEPAAQGQGTFETYRKTSLFPLTERVPAVLESSVVRRWLPWLGTWTPGGGPRVVPLKLPGGRVLRIAPLICYDAVDPGFVLAAVRRGADVIVTLSNDSWFVTGAGPRLHLVVSAFRSIETRRPQVRATNTGISAVISPTGEFLASAGIDERATLVATVAGGSSRSLMLAWGDWLGPTTFVYAVLLLAVPPLSRTASWSTRSRRRPRRPSP